MVLNYYDTLFEATTNLQERGFTTDFKFKKDRLISTSTENMYQKDDLQIVEYHRFEGMSNPADSSIIFAIETNAEEKGTVVMNYSAEANMNLFSFMDKVRIKKAE